MMFYVPLMCCEYRDVSLLTRVQSSQQGTASCDSAYTESKDAFSIQPSAMELSMNDKMCAPCVSWLIVMYIGIDDARDYNRFSVSYPCHYYGFINCHAKTFFL